MKSPRVIQLVLGDLSRDARVRKTGQALITKGYDVVYVGLDTSFDRAAPEFYQKPELDGVKHYVINRHRKLYDRLLKRLQQINPLMGENDSIKTSILRAFTDNSAPLNERIRTLAVLPSYVAGFAAHKSGALRQIEEVRGRRINTPEREARYLLELEPDIIHAHDLSALAHVAPYLDSTNIKLIYDSHELETGRNWGNSPEEVRIANSELERTWIDKADRVITVSDGVGLAIQRNYPQVEPVIIENAQPRSNIRPNTPLKQRLNLPENHKVILYLGGITFGRGLELLLQAFSKLPERTHLAFMGKMAPDYQTNFDQLIADVGIDEERLHILGVQAYEDVIHQAYKADLGFNALELCCESYENALPNKFFEYVFAEVPVISTPQRDVALLIERYALGRIVPDKDVDALITGLREMLIENPHQIDAPKRKEFIDNHCWEAQSHKLFQLYADLGYEIT